VAAMLLPENGLGSLSNATGGLAMFRKRMYKGKL